MRAAILPPLLSAFLVLTPATPLAGPVSPEPALIQGPARELVILPEELPGRFALQNGQDRPDGAHLAIYFRPEVLAGPALAGGALLGVMVSLELHPDITQAALSFANGSAGDGAQIPGGGQPVATQTLDAGVAGAGEASLERVEYFLQGVRVIDYRYRLRVKNAVIQLMISARAGTGGSEPLNFAEQARAIAEQQIRNLTATHSPGH